MKDKIGAPVSDRLWPFVMKSARKPSPNMVSALQRPIGHLSLVILWSLRHRSLVIHLPLLCLLLVSCQAPPREHGDFRTADLVELTTLDPAIRLEIRYASTNNFLGRPVYKQARAFLQRPAAEALVRANQ